MNTKGFLIYANGQTYVKQAYLCALSLKASKNNYPVSLVTCDNTDSKYAKAFDKIIDIPWYEKTVSRFHTEHRWKLYHATPYDETIVLDADMLVLQNLDYFWNFLNNRYLYFPTNVFTYRYEPVTDVYYRKAFVANNLPNVYNALHYFKKSSECKEFYAWVELVSNNWQLFYGNFCKEYYPKEPSMDITCAIVAKILDIEDEITNNKFDIPMIVHMKSRVQNWTNSIDSWQKRLGTYITPECTVKIGNFTQSSVLHYTENNFVTDDKISKFERYLGI